MKTYEQTIDLRLNVRGNQNPANLLPSLTTTQPLGDVTYVVADCALVRLWLCAPGTSVGVAAAHELLSSTGPMIVAFFDRQGGSELCRCAAWSPVEDEFGVHYEGELNMNTTAMLALFGAAETGTKTAWMEVELQSPGNVRRLTFQRACRFSKQSIVEGSPEPEPGDQLYPPAADIPSRQELQALLLQMQQLQTGSFSWYNADQGNWWLVRLSGAEGAEAITWDGPYDTPDEVPIADPYELTVGYSVSIVDGAGEAHTMELAEWVPVNSLFSVEGHGRLKVTDVQPLGTAGSAPTRLIFETVPGWTGGDIAVGAKLRLLYVAGAVGPQGAKGDKGDTGNTGPANTLTIGTVTTLAPGASATATVTGTAPAQTLSLGIPRGATGADGTTADTARIVALEAVRRGIGGVEYMYASGLGDGPIHGHVLVTPVPVGSTTLTVHSRVHAGVQNIMAGNASLGPGAWSLRQIASGGVYRLDVGWSPTTTFYLATRSGLGLSVGEWVTLSLQVDLPYQRVRMGVVRRSGVTWAAWQTVGAVFDPLMYIGRSSGGECGYLAAGAWSAHDWLLTDAQLQTLAADMLLPGALVPASGWLSGGGSGWSGVAYGAGATGSASGDLLTVERTSAGALFYPPTTSVVPSYLGRYYRVTAVVDSVTAGGSLVAFAANSAASALGSPQDVFAAGTYVWEGQLSDVGIGGSQGYMGLRVTSSGGWSGVVSSFRVETLTCQLALLPDAVTPGGGWLDRSRYARDARLGTGSGSWEIRPADARPQSRRFSGATTSGTASANKLTKVLTATGSDALALAAVRAGDEVLLVWGASGLPSGAIAATAYASAAGTVTVVYTTAGATDTVAAATPGIRHFL